MPVQPGTPIDLDDDAKRRLGMLLSEMLDDLEQTYSTYFTAIKAWNEWLEAKPKTKVKNFPFAGASNVVVPLTQVMCDAMVNRAFAGVFGGTRRIWMPSTQNTAQESIANEVCRWLNWAGDNNDFNFRLTTWDWFNEWVPFGSSVVCGNWRDDVRNVFVRQGRGASRKLISRPVRFGRGPLFETPPRETVLWDTTYQVGDAPLVAREYHFSWLRLRQIAMANEWDVTAVESIRNQGGVDSRAGDIARSKAAMDEFKIDRSLMEDHDIREIHVDWPLLASANIQLKRGNETEVDSVDVPLVVYLHRKTRRVLHVKAEPYLVPYKPFFDGFYSKRAGRGHTVGLAKRLQPMQEAMTALLNQAIDARTRANALWGRTSLRENLNKPIDPSTFFYDPGLNTISFEGPRNSQPFDEIALINMVNVFAERLTGQADPAMGRESRQGGHPSPATSTLALLQQADIVTGGRRELARAQLSRMGEFAASLYQQYEDDDDGRLDAVLGREDANKIRAYLFAEADSPMAPRFDLVAMNETSNPEAEMRRQIAISQMNSNYWAFVLRAIQAAQLARQTGDPIMMQAAIISIKAQTTAHTRFLEAGDVDDIEKFILALNEGNAAGGPQGPDAQAALGGLTEMAGASGAMGQSDLGRPARVDERLPAFAPGGLGAGAQLQ